MIRDVKHVRHQDYDEHDWVTTWWGFSIHVILAVIAVVMLCSFGD